MVVDSPIHDNSEANITAKQVKMRLRQYFFNYPPQVQHLLDVVPADSILENCVFDVDFIEDWFDGPVVLLGDAAHAMTPALGQGANVGLEDAIELAHALAPVVSDLKNSAEVERSLQTFNEIRRDRVKRIHFASREHGVARSRRDGSSYERNEKFDEWLWGWEPSFVESSST